LLDFDRLRIERKPGITRIHLFKGAQDDFRQHLRAPSFGVFVLFQNIHPGTFSQNEAIAIDRTHHLIVTANGGDASLSVVRQVSDSDYRAVETVGTRAMARTMFVLFCDDSRIFFSARSASFLDRRFRSRSRCHERDQRRHDAIHD
jgi:hypothetical protein